MHSARRNRRPPRQLKSGLSLRFIAFLNHCPPGPVTPRRAVSTADRSPCASGGESRLPHRRSSDAIRAGRCPCARLAPSTPRGRKKARITKIRAYRNYYCHAVLMALSQTGPASGGSPIVHAQCERPGAASHDALSRRPLATSSPPLILARRIRTCPHIAGDIAAQIATRRRRREVAIAGLALLPRFQRGLTVRAPVPTLRTLLRECRCGYR